MVASLNQSLVDRHLERTELLGLLARNRPALALLTGRRRVGKTFLLANTWPEEQFFLFTAARTTPELNRRQLVEDLALWRGESLLPADFPTWRSVFRLIAEVATERALREPALPTVIVLDEFQYLGEGETGLSAVASELNAVWESRAVQKPVGRLPLLVVLAGSAVSTMESLANGGAPLYGRFDRQHTLQPFTYVHAAELAPFTSLRDRALTFGMFGGTPRYLAALDTRKPLSRNVTELLLSPRGEVRLLVETALDQEEGLRDVAKYRGILRAVADGRNQRNLIAQHAGLANDQGLRQKLETLIALGYLEERRNIDAQPNAPVRYAIADAAVRFYHRFVAPNASALARYPANALWNSRVAPRLDSYMGLEFERIASQAYDALAAARSLPLVARWGKWEGTDRRGESLEIDVVAECIDGTVMTGSVKWDARPIAAHVHHTHLEMLHRAADAGRRWAHAALEPSAPLYYLAAAGFTDQFRKAVDASGHPAVLWSLEDIYP